MFATAPTTLAIPTAGLGLFATIIGAVWIMLQIGDRLWFKKFSQDDMRSLADRDRSLIEGLVEAQRAMLEAVRAMAADSKHASEIAKLRHQEVMKSLELLERKLVAGSS